MITDRQFGRAAGALVLGVALFGLTSRAFGTADARADQARGYAHYRIEWENTVALGLPPVSGAPDKFVTAPGEDPRSPPGVCPERLSDRRTRRVLMLVRSESKALKVVRGDSTFISHESWGDYVPAKKGEYGLAHDEALRVDCGPNLPLGRVRLDLSTPRGLPTAR